MHRRLAPLLIAAIAATSACSTEDVFVPEDPTDLVYAPELNVDFARMTQTASGLWYEDLQIGEGDLPIAGDSVFVLYSGWLNDGTLFDSVTDSSDPLFFIYLVDPVIAGFAEGVGGMRPGGIRKLVIPPHLGYGSQPRGPIPAYSTLVFQVSLLNIGRP